MAISTRSSIAFSAGGRYLILSLQFFSTTILARLLTPEDIGIYTAGYSIIAFAHLFRDFGLNQYLIQEKELTNEKIRATFTLSLLIAWSFGFIIYFGSTAAANFFAEEGVKTLLQLLSISFFIIPFGSITLAILRKNLKFHITTQIYFVSTLAGIAVAVSTAFAGAKYMCLAYGAVTETAIVVLLSLLFRPKGLPLLPCFKGVKNILRFGSIVGLGNIVTQFATSATDALIARIMGLAALGFFSRALGTFSLFNIIFVGSIQTAILPLFSRENKVPKKLADAYLKSVEYSCIFAWPFFGFLFLFTPETIRVLYGSQWDAAIPVIKILCAAGMLLPPMLFVENLFIAAGRPGITLKIQIISNVAKLALVIPACFFGLEALAFALVGFFIVKLITSLLYIKSVLEIDSNHILSCVIKAVPSFLTALVPSFIASLLLANYTQNPFVIFPVLAVLTMIGWLLGLILGKHAFINELKLLFNNKNVSEQD